MSAIPFTQFMPPRGQRRQVEIERPAAVVRKALEIIANGFRFEMEQLSTGTISLTVADPVIGQDVAIELCFEESGTPHAVDRLVNQFIIKDALDHRTRVKQEEGD